MGHRDFGISLPGNRDGQGLVLGSEGDRWLSLCPLASLRSTMALGLCGAGGLLLGY